ncbi:MAG: serine/threonine protein phosphatase [Oligoflexia bacterium]|nr:serine/threonine protein phosphatase [Oligoflexia bacterium]
MSQFRELGDMKGRLFAIGDVHGCADELELLLSHLTDSQGLSTNDRVVFIGDYIDRGAESKRAVETVLSFRNRFPETIFLRGNHEEMLLGYLGLRPNVAPYLKNGGLSTLQSYGVAEDASAEEALSLFPPEHIEFFKATERYVLMPGYVFVHAGLNPLRRLEDQPDEDIYWIRDTFILNRHRFDRVVVFGHTPFEDVLLNLPYKIGLDTGAVFGNKLSCVELTESLIFQVPAGENKVNTRNFKALSKRD